MPVATVYLIPTVLHEGQTDALPAYILPVIKQCTIFFVENERTARRYLKALDKNIVIDEFEWFTIHKAEEEQRNNFRQKIKDKKNIAIISEAGCPGTWPPLREGYTNPTAGRRSSQTLPNLGIKVTIFVGEMID